MMIAVISMRIVDREGRQLGSERDGRRDAVGPLLRWRLSKFIMRVLPINVSSSAIVSSSKIYH
jgi:hypothetical protein